MKLKRVRIENFRCYQDITICIDNLTTIIGKNDIGKSSILEALEIFFNNETVKIDPTDVNIYSGDNKTVSITCDFTCLPESPKETGVPRLYENSNQGLFPLAQLLILFVSQLSELLGLGEEFLGLLVL